MHIYVEAAAVIVPTAILDWLGPAGLFFGLLAPILLPVYYFAVLVQMLLGCRWFLATSKQALFVSIISVEILAPALFLLLYPAMPGGTLSGEPVGASEKALRAAGATGVICTALFFVSVVLLDRARTALREQA
jgi:hypothetical protein